MFEEECLKEMALNGVPFTGPLIADGKIQRYSADSNKRKPDEWYIAFEGISSKNNPYLIVVYGSWSTSCKFIYRSWANSHSYLDEKERRELHAVFDKRRKEAEQLLKELHERAAIVAQQIWEMSSDTPLREDYCAYAKLKDIEPISVRFGDNPQGYPSMIIPIRNVAGKIRSLQFISVGEDGCVYKTFLGDGEKKGNFMVLGLLQDCMPMQVAEGYSTASSCYRASQLPTVVAFDCGNLPNVVRQMREKHPNSVIIICGDDDCRRDNNPGRSAALEAAIEHNCKVTFPDFPQNSSVDIDPAKLTDFNDLMRVAGQEEVKRQIEMADVPLKVLLQSVSHCQDDWRIRDYIYKIAFKASSKGDLSQKDIILNGLYQAVKSLGVEKSTINKEFKKFIKERGEIRQASGHLSSKLLPEEDKNTIEMLTEIYGEPLQINHDGKAKGVNQLFFASKFGHERSILYEPVEAAFYEYQPDTGLWIHKSDNNIKIELGKSFHKFISQLGCEHLINLRTNDLLQDLINLLKGIVEQINAFQRKRGIIHVANGVIRLNEDPDILCDFEREYFSRNRSDIAVDPKAECPRFLQELLAPALAREDITLLQKYCGQCLLGYNPSQTILLMLGTPGGGKSTLVSIIERIIGSHNIAQLKVNLLAERFEVVSFFGKTLLTGKDVPGNFLENPSGSNVLKSLVGGDRLSAEQKNRKTRFELVGEFNIIITSNARLHLRIDSDLGAWRRRLLMIEYEHPPTEKPIPNFAELLVSEEGPGILNWMIEGAIIIMHELSTHGRIQLSERQKKRIDVLLSESDSIFAFVKDCLKITNGRDATLSELNVAYVTFCQERGWQLKNVSSFENQMKNAMLQIYKVSLRHDIKREGRDQRGFKHIEILNPDLE